MATEEGVVIRLDRESAWVKTTRTGACRGCSARGSCHAAGNADEMEVKALNSAGARVGDRIVLAVQSGSLLKVVFLIYVFPVLMMVGGASLGNYLAAGWQLDVSLGALLGGFVFLALGVFAAKTLCNRLAGRKGYQPRIVKIRC
jgi:sigma-E factor negative regulatory protein RseC